LKIIKFINYSGSILRVNTFFSRITSECCFRNECCFARNDSVKLRRELRRVCERYWLTVDINLRESAPY